MVREQHAVARMNRMQLERLCRTITRRGIGSQQLKCNRAGQLVLQPKSPYRDGTTHIMMSRLTVPTTTGRTGAVPQPPSTVCSSRTRI